MGPVTLRSTKEATRVSATSVVLIFGSLVIGMLVGSRIPALGSTAGSLIAVLIAIPYEALAIARRAADRRARTPREW